MFTSTAFIKPSFAALAAALFLAGTASAADIVTAKTDLGNVALPFSQQYGHTFSDSDFITPGLQLPGVPGTLLATDRFFDDYGFTITDAGFSAITATIDLGSVLNISNLQARIYRGDLQSTSVGNVGSNLLQAWSDINLVATSSGSGNVQVINPLNLSAGSYVLEIRGNVTGSFGGTYVGALNLSAPVAAVPEPSSILLALAGMGALVLIKRSRRQSR